MPISLHGEVARPRPCCAKATHAHSSPIPLVTAPSDGTLSHGSNPGTPTASGQGRASENLQYLLIHLTRYLIRPATSPPSSSDTAAARTRESTQSTVLDGVLLLPCVPWRRRRRRRPGRGSSGARRGAEVGGLAEDGADEVGAAGVGKGGEEVRLRVRAGCRGSPRGRARRRAPRGGRDGVDREGRYRGRRRGPRGGAWGKGAGGRGSWRGPSIQG